MKKHFVRLSIFLLSLLLCTSTVTLLIQDTNAQETDSTATKGLSIIDKVVGVDTTKYAINQTSDTTGTYLDILPTENIIYHLNKDDSDISILETFTNGSLQIMYILTDTGSHATNAIKQSITETAKSFLSNYQTYSSNPIYGKLAAMLFNSDSTKNSTIISDNIQLSISNIQNTTDSTTFTWSYTYEGINVPLKCVSLIFENNALKEFIDTWNLYKIGSTAINISKAQAENIAMSNAKGYSWTVGWGNNTHVINNFNVTKPMVEQLFFYPVGNTANSRNSDPLVLYPVWRIGVGLDKYYPGDIYGIYVDVWADTGQVRDIQEAISTLPPSGLQDATITESSIDNQNNSGAAQSNMLSTMWLVCAGVVTLTSIPIYMAIRKKQLPSLKSLKTRKVVAALLCLLTCSMVVTALGSSIPTVGATSASQIWADSCSTSPGAHTQQEIQYQQNLSGNISNWFAAHGYDSYNEFGATYKSSVLNAVQTADSMYSSVSTLWFDHGIGRTPLSYPYQNEWHYMLCDSNNNFIYDYEIYSATANNKNYFSFISTCLSADLQNGNQINSTYTGTYGSNQGGSGNPLGMPYAWTHRNCSSIPTSGYMSSNGMGNPDSGPYCYIGYPWGSPALSQTLKDGFTATYGMFVYEFYYYAFQSPNTVHTALDLASSMCFNCQWSSSPFAIGFTTNWPDLGNPSGCTMAVYGNAGNHIY